MDNKVYCGDVKVKFLSIEAEAFGLPRYAYDGDAGVDLTTVLNEEDRKNGVTIFPHERALLPTGIAIEIPEGFWGSIQHRSSTEKKFRLRVVQGTIDTGYRGPLFVQVSNTNSFPITIHHGDRIAQLIFIRKTKMQFKTVSALTDSERNTNGFGSSGHKTSLGAIENASPRT